MIQIFTTKTYFLKSLLIILFSFFSIYVKAQQNYVEGYYVNLKGDTISGFINDKNWERNPKSFDFKSSKSANSNLINNDQAKSFGLRNGEIYEVHSVNIDKSARDIQQLNENDKDVITQDFAFLRVLFRGAYNLLYLKEDNDNFYLQKANNSPELLRIRKFIQKVDGKNSLAISEIYKGQLINYFSDCPNIKKEIERTGYSQNSLLRLFQKYSLCKGVTNNFESAPEKTKIRFGFTGGVGKGDLTFSSSDFKYLTANPFNISFSYQAGIAAELFFPRKNSKISIYNELLYKPYLAKGYYEEINGPESYTKMNSEIGYNYIGLGTMVRYYLNLKNIRPFFNLGLANNYAFGETNSRKLERRFYTTEENTEDKVIKDGTRKYEQAILLGAGAELKKYTAELRFERGNGMSLINSLGARKKIFSFMLGYYFN